MDWAPVLAAVVAALGGVAVVLLQRRRQRRRQRQQEGEPPPPPPSRPSRPSLDHATFAAELDALTWAQAERRVLIVDDNASLSLVMARAITMDKRYAVRVVHRGEECRKHVESDPPPDLFIVDLYLPDMTGMQLVADIRRAMLGRQPLILIISGKTEQGALDQLARACGADAGLAKPFGVEALEQMVRLLFEARAAGGE